MIHWLERNADPIAVITVVAFALLAFLLGDGVR